MKNSESSFQRSNASTKAGVALDPPDFHVVAIGASAGGLESLEQFFKEMPADTGMAFVVLQHLSPDFRSLMDELLARHTEMEICKAEDDMAVEPNTIYLNPPRKNMIISGGNLYLSDVDPDEPLSLPIDQFFRSLAQDSRRKSIAVVLSGTGSDGSRGIRDVYEAGGLVLAETEETAKFDGMPRSAQETGCVHVVLPPAAMPEALSSYINQSLSPQDFAEKVIVPPRMGGMEAIFRLIREEYGIDFSHYKPNTVVRRVERRVSLLHSADIDDYVSNLENDHEELNALYRDLLIGVTRFFRDTEAFSFLKAEVIPELIAKKADGDELRVWVAGCASGEEAYSLAILIDEALRSARKNLDVKIFATDIHPNSLEFAATGFFPKESLSQVDPERIKRYFEESAEGFQVNNHLRQMMVFAKHNVFKDAPFTRLDAISCRNLLIYLQPLAQKKALSLFHFGLRTGGILILGPSESPGELKEEFDVCNNRWKVYRKRRDVRLPAEIRLPLGTSVEPLTAQKPNNANQPSPTPQRNLLLAYDKLLARYMPAAFLIDEERNLLHVFGEGKDFLEPRSGRVTTDLLEMVRGDLKPILGSAIQRIRHGTENTISTVVSLDFKGSTRKVLIQIEKLMEPTMRQVWFCISLETRERIPSPTPTDEISQSDFSEVRLNDLEVELRYTKESLQATVEELETSNEELQATNEELVASNEELQSTNEELHSVNEELYTVNAEFQNKIAELTELTNDMDNLLESTEIGTIFLDKNLTIRKFTGKVEKWFDLMSRDIGRKISVFTHNLKHPDLLADVQQVLNQEQPLEREVLDQEGKWLHLRLHPYLTDGKTMGVVMTLIDISNLKQTHAKLQRLSAIVESSDDAIIGKSFEGIIETWNHAAEQLFGYTAEEAIGRDISLILPANTTDEARQYFDQLKRGESVETLETHRRTKDGRLIEISLRFSPIRSETGEVIGMSAICRDITSRKSAEREIEKLALVVKHTDNGVILTDAQGYTEWINEGCTRISGYTLDDFVGRKPGHLLQGPESDPATIDLMRRKISAGEEFSVEVLNYSKKGEPYWVAIDARPTFSENRELTGFMAIQRDVSKLKAAQAEAQLEVQRRDEFLAMLSHELRNPLGALQNGLQLLQLQKDLDSSEAHELEEILSAQVEQMSRLLDDLLDVARVTQNKALVHRQPMDLCEAARNAAEAVRPLAERRGCPLKLQLPSSPVVVNGDSARLQQVQVNLLTNAIRHSYFGEHVSLQIEVRDGNAVISVTDIGEGISAEHQVHVFDLFFQTNSELARTEGGLGVGLSLVRDFVAKHDGEVSLHSDGPGKGTTFEVTLPLAQDKVLPQETSCDLRVPPLRVVLIEDQEMNRKTLRKMLELDGHEVLEAADASQGIQLIDEQRPDLAVVDIGLPDMPGYEVARATRRLDPPVDTLLAALTGYGQDSDIEKAYQAGFDVHLIKPFDPRRLNEFLANSRKNFRAEEKAI
ncbi:chemotaxis protein CheB [Bythopirellula goksoeyrii]|uniref:Autoinducer 2 sensor kinase/phosphatase LuxQ n=1 Tax=Bythopirellula goksoeyrii TaxID=1400387 RepID=A0A5B9Q6E7_9BACT|nr:chemotaxis protein CheB [Bythopirellula goksoeyrii]QEG33289.1 Autoinducer 2 sensor kinase/phosphatase LuxQ [Bythopirellula goksoeyrii]